MILITKIKIVIAKYLLMIISIFKDIQITQFTRKGVTWHTPLNDIVGLSLYLLGTFENKNIKISNLSDLEIIYFFNLLLIKSITLLDEIFSLLLFWRFFISTKLSFKSLLPIII